jgi:hypothetical protein
MGTALCRQQPHTINFRVGDANERLKCMFESHYNRFQLLYSLAWQLQEHKDMHDLQQVQVASMSLKPHPRCLGYAIADINACIELTE